MNDWSNFCLGELGAASALAGLLFVAVAVNQGRILELGRMADRGLEALIILMLVVFVASLPLVPGQPPRILGMEIFAVSAAALVTIVILQRGYLRGLEQMYLRRSALLAAFNRFAVTLIILGGLLLLWRGDAVGMYLLPPGVLFSFIAAGANAWVLLIEINR